MPTESHFTVQLKVLPNNSSTDNRPQRQVHRIHFSSLDDAFLKLQSIPQAYFDMEQVKKEKLEGLVQHASIVTGNDHRPAVHLLNFFSPADSSMQRFEKAPGPVLYFLKDDITQQLSTRLRDDLLVKHPTMKKNNFIVLDDEKRTLSPDNVMRQLDFVPGYFYSHTAASKLYGDMVPPGEPPGITVKDITPSVDLRKSIVDMLQFDINTVDPLISHNAHKDRYQMSTSVRDIVDDRSVVKLASVRYEGVVPEMSNPGLYLAYESRHHRRLAEAVLPELKKLGMPDDSLSIQIARYQIDPTMRPVLTAKFFQLQQSLVVPETLSLHRVAGERRVENNALRQAIRR